MAGHNKVLYPAALWPFFQGTMQRRWRLPGARGTPVVYVRGFLRPACTVFSSKGFYNDTSWSSPPPPPPPLSLGKEECFAAYCTYSVMGTPTALSNSIDLD